MLPGTDQLLRHGKGTHYRILRRSENARKPPRGHSGEVSCLNMGKILAFWDGTDYNQKRKHKCGRPQGGDAPHGPVRVNKALSTAVIQLHHGPIISIFRRLCKGNGFDWRAFAWENAVLGSRTRHCFYVSGGRPKGGNLPPPGGVPFAGR